MARMFWKGSLSFGLVEIPVGLRTAVRPDELDFTLLDRKDFSPIGYRRYNKTSGREVSQERMVRGYEFEPDQYVVLSDEELRGANVKATRAIEIVQFVDGSEIPPRYYETPYWVEPVKKDSKSYVLLRDVMRRTGRVGIARVVLKTRQHLAALQVQDDVLVLELLRYPYELVPAKELDFRETLGKVRVGDAEQRMAAQLIEGMSAPWDPSVFHDEYRDDVLALVRRKVESGKIHAILEPAEEKVARAPREVVDLMPLLKASLAAQRDAGVSQRGRKHRPPSRNRQPARGRAHRPRRPARPAAGRRTERASA